MMLRIIVNVRRADQNADYDLEVPAETPMAELSRYISLALGWQDLIDKGNNCFVYAMYPERVISSENSLAEAEIWDGSTLVFDLLQKTSENYHTSSQIHLVSNSGKRYIISSSPTILGRRTPSTSAIANLIDFGAERSGKSVSRRHAKLEWIDGRWRLTPLHGSHNRTLINSEQITQDESRTVHQHDKIILGDLILSIAEIKLSRS